MPEYIDTIYTTQSRPLTAYPGQLCTHLAERFGMRAGDQLLDVGCGRGDFTRAFRELGLDVRGVDREKSRSELLDEIEVRCVDLEKERLPFPDDSLDFVFSKSVIEHLSDPEHFIAEQRRVLKPGGRLICLTPDWMSQIKVFYIDHTHRQPYTVVSLGNLLRIFEFRNVESEIFYQLPVLWKHPWMKIASKALQLLGPPARIHRNKFIRFSRELMILASGVK